MSSRFVLWSSSRLSALFLSLICVAYSVWVLSLPLFPTQDGPMHLYFTHVLQSVLTHPEGFYSHFYFVRHILPPYALYYYALMGLSSFMSILLADKIIVCLYFFLFAFGFRYLARAIGPSGDFAAILATLLLFNWPLGMGFINFCLSTAIALWTLGVWCRVSTHSGWRRQVGFVALCYVILLTHPVPLLAVLGFAGVDLFIRWLRERSLMLLWADLLTLVAASGTLIYVSLFTTSHIARQVHLSPKSSSAAKGELLKGYVLLHSLTAFAGRSAADALYRALFYALFAGAIFAALTWFRRRRSTGSWTKADTWTLGAVAFLLLFPFIPSDLNHSAYFSARLVLFLWIGALAAASGAPEPGPKLRASFVALAAVGAVLTLVLAQSRIRPVAMHIADAESMVPIRTHSIGLLMHDPAYHAPTGLTYDPFFWSGVRMFRRTDSVLWNTPWLDLAIIPLGPQQSMPTYRLSPNDLEDPVNLRKRLEASPTLRTTVLSDVSFVMFSAGTNQPARHADSLLLPTDVLPAQASGPQWACEPDAEYSICTSPHP